VDCHDRASALGLAGGDHHGYADTEDIADRPADVPLLGKPFRDKDLLDSIFLAIANAEP
jgi:hypothetical protein